jgi:hypothetical protein
MKAFFISYTQADEPWAKWIAWTLEEAGFSVAIQAWDFRPGENFVLRMHQATAEADKTIVVLSQAYLQSAFTRAEWAAAFAQDPQGNARKLIPIRVAECEPTGLLASIIYVDLLGLAQDDARAALLGAFSERAKPRSMPTFPGAQGPRATKPVYPGPITATATSSAKVGVRLLKRADHSRVLSASQRFQLILRLNSISPQQFNMLLFALDPPSGLVPPMPIPQGDRMLALLTWAEGPTGCGLSVIEEVLDESKRTLITTVEFILEQSLVEFDAAKFQIALHLATEIDTSQFRIASVRSGSTIVNIEGEQETLAAIIRKIQSSQEVAHQLALETGMRKMVWYAGGTRYALTVDPSGANDENAAETDNADIKEVVLLVHGIRDFAEWEQKVSPILERIPYTRVPPLSYGRFDAFRFWFPIWTRETPVKKLLWRIRFARDKFPTAKLSVIAHSFGTYAIGQILRENPDIRLHRLILCGAILPSEFRWDQIRYSVATEIINDCGTRDIWPVLAQSTTFGYGSSGRFGFGSPGVRDRYHDFGHGGFFEDNFVTNYWLPWFRSGNFVKSKAPPRSGTRWHFLAIIQIKWVAMFVCVLCISWLGMWWFPPVIPTPPVEKKASPTPKVRVQPSAPVAVPSISARKSEEQNYPYGTQVPGKPGYVLSPYVPGAGEVDVRGFSPGAKVQDPYTGKIFLVP